MNIIERILFLAKDRNIKEVDIARAIGKGTGQITNWKNRGTTPPAELLPAISQLLNVSIEYLITGIDHIAPGTVLPPAEQQLLDYYHAANTDGQKQIIDHAEYISTKYPKPAGKSSEYKIG